MKLENLLSTALAITSGLTSAEEMSIMKNADQAQYNIIPIGYNPLPYVKLINGQFTDM